MPPHSFTRALFLFLSFPSLQKVHCSWNDGPGSCTPNDFGGFRDIWRVDLNPNIFSSSKTLASQRGIYLWVGAQYWRTDANPRPDFYPILTVLSTSYNQSYISISPDGSQDAPCPSSYQWDQNGGPDSPPDGCCSFNSSYTCHGYYDFATSKPFYFETPINFTGSPEDPAAAAKLQAAGVKYGTMNAYLILPETTQTASLKENSTATAINRLSLCDDCVLGFVDKREEQVLGLGLNSTFLNYLYDRGSISSRSIGLYFGVPATAGEDLARNGAMVMGGYSKTRLLGDLFEQTYPIGDWKLERHCPWEVDVAKISGGKDLSVEGFTACVEPSELDLVLPKSIYDQFSGTDQNITITLTNGLVAIIPSVFVSMRAVDDADQSPILGMPWLTQVYLFADYQAKTLSTGVANNTLKWMKDFDTLECVEHPSSMNNLGWAVNTTETSSSTQSPSSSTKTPPSTSPGTSKETGKPGAASRIGLKMGLLVINVSMLGLWLV